MALFMIFKIDSIFRLEGQTYRSCRLYYVLFLLHLFSRAISTACLMIVEHLVSIIYYPALEFSRIPKEQKRHM